MKIYKGYDKQELLTFNLSREYISIAFLGFWLSVIWDG